MKILMIYRSKDSGPSMRRVFEPIENELKKTNDVDSVFLPIGTASLFDIYKNVRFIRDYLKERSYDVIHITGHVNYLVWVLRKYNTIVTVHDLGFYTKYSSGLRKKLLYYFFIYPLKFAKHITYISDTSFNEANRIIDLKGKRQTVIYNPVNSEYKPLLKKIDVNKPVILHLGTKINKNLPRVIEAVSGVKCVLHIIGKVSDSLQCKIKELDIDSKIEYNLSDNEIIDAYMKCDIVCFPSLYEGFGMPIIEGQAIGRPVVTSNIDPMKTIAGDGAVLVDPYSVDSIKNGIEYALNHYNDIVDKGFKNVSKFSVNSITNKYLQIYSE